MKKNKPLKGMLAATVVFVLFILHHFQRKPRLKNKKWKRLNRLFKNVNDAKSTVVSNMFHDIRTPINAVIGYARLAEADLDNRELVQDYLAKILSAGNYLLELIDDVMDISKVGNGKLDLEMSEMSLTEVLTDVETMVSSQLQEKQLKFHMNMIHVANPNVYCDKIKLNRVLLNLLSNAIKFTPSGGTIILTLEQLSCALEEEGMYEIRVKDNGIGMSQEFAEHIFEAFERENNSTVSEIQGTGLGMSICKNIVEAMGGTIRVKIKKDKGTEVIICLRLKLADVPKTSEKKSELTISNIKDVFAGKHLLLVEDNQMNMEIASRIFKSYGFHVDKAENGKESLEKIKASDGKYDLICMDVHMPFMNAYEVTQCIRAFDNPALSQIPILVMTANAHEKERQMSKKYGVNGFIAKPYNIGEIDKALKDILGYPDDSLRTLKDTDNQSVLKEIAV